jgi:hypothetical protein
LKSLKSMLRKSGDTLGGARGIGKSIIVIIGRWSACVGRIAGLVQQESKRLDAWWESQTLSGLVQLWVTVSKVGKPGGRERSMLWSRIRSSKGCRSCSEELRCRLAADSQRG